MQVWVCGRLCQVNATRAITPAQPAASHGPCLFSFSFEDGSPGKNRRTLVNDSAAGFWFWDSRRLQWRNCFVFFVLLLLLRLALSNLSIASLYVGAYFAFPSQLFLFLQSSLSTLDIVPAPRSARRPSILASVATILLRLLRMLLLLLFIGSWIAAICPGGAPNELFAILYHSTVDLCTGDGINWFYKTDIFITGESGY